MYISIFWDNLFENKKKRKEFINLLEGKTIKKVKVFESPDDPDVEIILDDGTKLVVNGYEYDLWIEKEED